MTYTDNLCTDNNKSKCEMISHVMYLILFYPSEFYITIVYRPHSFYLHVTSV